MWKVSWHYEKVHNFLVVLLYYMAICCMNKNCVQSSYKSLLLRACEYIYMYTNIDYIEHLLMAIVRRK